MIRRTALGPFTWTAPCWTSEPISVPLFGGAELQIQIFAEQDDIDILGPAEIAVLDRFLALPEDHRLQVIPHLWRYYLDMRESVGPPEIPEVAGPATIWSHITPRFISLDHGDLGDSYIVVEAQCDWEIEHGLQLVLQDGDRWIRVSSYDGHLTDGRAWGKGFLDKWIADPSQTLPVRGRDDFIARIPREFDGGLSLKWISGIWGKRD